MNNAGAALAWHVYHILLTGEITLYLINNFIGIMQTLKSKYSTNFKL